MSLLSAVEAIWAKDETWVLNLLADLKKVEQVTASDLNVALTWIATHATDITNTVTQIEKLIVGSGIISLTPQVIAAITAANTAVAAINQYAANVNAGQNNLQAAAQAVVQGYVATKQAQTAANAAAIAFAQAPALAK